MYTKLEKQLEPYKNVVFYNGLKEDEIVTIEKYINKKFPPYFREFLKTFGVLQDFVFGLMSRKHDFNSQNYLPKEIQQSYIQIGDNGGEDCWLLNIEDERDTNIYDWESWNLGEIKQLDFNFQTLLDNSLSLLSQTAADRPTNELKYWAVQFSVSTNNVNDILSAIPIKLTGDWASTGISPAKVHTSEVDIMLNGEKHKLKRQEYEGWASPCYYFNMRESVINLTNDSLIEYIDRKLSKLEGYKLIDYGILDYE